MTFYKKSRLLSVAAFLLMLQGIANGQQTKQPSRIELQTEIVRLRAALADCQNGNRVADESAKLRAAREDAIASLRAVKSALSTGANLEEFKKYQIESRIKVDALPDVPENRGIRDASDFYREAITFSIISLTGGKIDAEELAASRELHQNDDAVLKALAEMKSDDEVEKYAQAKSKEHSGSLGYRVSDETFEKYMKVFRENAYTNNRISAKEVSQILIILAEDKVSKLK